MLSIIIPCYNEQDNLSSLHIRLKELSKKIPNYDFEFIFVDDCSEDESPNILQNLAADDRRIKMIRFARNCGSHSAIAAGINFCKGDATIMLAADLQDPPEIIPHLIKQWEKGFKVVWGVREARKGESFFIRVCSRIFYHLMNHLTSISQPPTGADIFLIDRVVIEAFKKSPEKNVSVFMLIAWLGFSQSQIKYVKEKRYSGSSKWTLSSRLKLFLDSLISFSYIPLRFMSLLGAISALIGFFYGIVVFINALRGVPILGWSSMMIIVLLLGGFQMSMLGMLGEYLWRTYDEARGRPRYVIEKNTLLEDKSLSDKTENAV